MAEDNARQSEVTWTPGRIIATAVIVTLIAAGGYMFFFASPAATKNPKISLPGTPAAEGINTPKDFDIATLDSETFKLSYYRGKVLVIDFWATWCPPCRKEVPQLVRLANNNSVQVVGLHIDDRGRSTPQAIRGFIDQFKINYKVGLANDEMFLAYLGRDDDTIPQTLVFGRDGRAVAHFIGYADASAKDLDEAVNRALSR